MPEKDFLFLHLRDLPYFRALLRAVEAQFYQSIDLPAPVLDLGSGDGHFASLTFDRRLDAGLDPWMDSLRESRGRGVYRLPVAPGSFPHQWALKPTPPLACPHVPGRGKRGR